MARFPGETDSRSVAATLQTDGRPVEPEDVVPSPSGMGYIAGEHITASLDFAGGCTGTLLQHRFPAMDTRGPTSSRARS